MKVVDPGGNGAQVEAVWMYLVQHGENDESVAAFETNMGWMPMVATTEAVLKKMGDAAQLVATVGGKPLKLVLFDQRTDIGTVLP